MPFEKQLQSLVATFYCPMGGEQRCDWLLGRRKTSRASLSHHVVVVVPLDDVGGREQLLLDGRGRGRGWLHPGLEQVGHVEHLVDAERESKVSKHEDIGKNRRGQSDPNKDLKLQRSIYFSFMRVSKDSLYWIVGRTKNKNNKAITMWLVAALI